MPKQGSLFWVVSMWACYGIALAAVLGRRWWIAPIGWVAGTFSATKT